jgi:hypothetical protein
MVVDSIAVSIFDETDPVIGLRGHLWCLHGVARGLAEEQAATFINSAQHRVGHQVRPGHVLDNKAVGHMNCGQSGRGAAMLRKVDNGSRGRDCDNADRRNDERSSRHLHMFYKGEYTIRHLRSTRQCRCGRRQTLEFLVCPLTFVAKRDTDDRVNGTGVITNRNGDGGLSIHSFRSGLYAA